MKLLKRCLQAWTYVCVVTLAAELSLLLVLWQRGQLNHDTAENLLFVAYDVPLRDMHQKMIERSKPPPEELASVAELDAARNLISLDLDLREMFAEKGMVDFRDLELLLKQDTEQNTALILDFRRNWEALLQGATNSELQDVRRQIESVSPNLAKDQLLRILNDKDLNPDQALDNVVTIFKSLPVDKRKKIVMEFKDRDSESLLEILRQIRQGVPQITLIRDTRDRMEQANTHK